MIRTLSGTIWMREQKESKQWCRDEVELLPKIFEQGYYIFLNFIFENSSRIL